MLCREHDRSFPSAAVLPARVVRVIDFKNVSLEYPVTRTLALDDVSL